jgi:glycosyltransferase involved in cell wall biosynthesis
LVDWFDPLSITRLWRWIRCHRIEILHTHTPRDYYIAAVATLGTSTVNIGSRHHLQPISHGWIKKPFLRRFATMIAVSDAVRDGILNSGVLDPDRVQTIHNGIDTDRDLPARDGLRRRAQLDLSKPVIGFVGRLCPDKGVETLLVSVQRLVQQGWSDLQVFLVGDDLTGGRYKARLQRLIRDLGLKARVHLFGYVEDAARAAADFDIQVVCSDAEPFGLVTLEGMAHSHPVVATASGGSPEIIRDGIDGFLVPPRDPVALAATIHLLLTRPELRRRIGAEAKSRVARRFTLRRMLDKTESVYLQRHRERRPRNSTSL